MYKSIYCLILVASFICNDAISQKNSQSNENRSQIQVANTLRNFYSAYFTLQSDPSQSEENFRKIDSLLKRYCTKEFINFYKNIQGPDELDWDPFLDAQFCVLESLKTLTIKKDSKRDDLYYVSYVKPNDYKKLTIIEISIIKEREIYKIDSLPQLTRHIESVRSHK